MLQIAQQVIKKFNDLMVLYCHWKSNEHLEAGLNGKTDLDILVARKHFKDTNQILLSLGFKRCKTVDYLDYHSVEDFIGFDEETGKLIHIHLHYELVIGNKFLKEYHLPIENKILNSRILNKKNNIYVCNPEYELVLLFMRRALKFSMLRKNGYWKGFFPKNEKKEFLWLLDRIKKEKVAKIAEEIVDNEFKNYLINFITKFDKTWIRLIRKKAKNCLAKYSSYSIFEGYILYLVNKFKAASKYLRSTKGKQPLLYRRGFKEGGLIVVLLGVDGAGKSTIIKNIIKWLTWKIDVQHIYFGSGDGSSSLLRVPLKLVAQIRRKIKGNVINKEKKDYEKKKDKLIFRFAKSLWALTLALEKKKKLKKMWKARNNGMVVLCDRFPQTQFYGFNDGPLLRDWVNSKSSIKRKLSRWEYNVYQLVEELSPDIIIKLTIPLSLAASRKKDTPLYKLNEKKNVVDKLTFIDVKRVYTVDSSGSIEETSLKVRKIIWGFGNE